jgi:signal peptidase I
VFVVALAAAIALAVLCLALALWNPVAALPGIVFLLVAYGIWKRRPWSAWGGALFILSLLAAALATAARSGDQAAMKGIAVESALLMGLALILYLAGRWMPARVSVGSRRVWIAMALVVFLFPQIMRPFVVPTGSMDNTLLTGDRILVRPLTGAPARGDLVALRYPVDPKQTFIKRVVAVGGDRLRIENKRLILNGAPVDEPYAIHLSSFIDRFRDNFPAQPEHINVRLPREGWEQELRQDTVGGELVVPAGKFFVLGDNRDNSLDSRYWGFLEGKDFVGKPAMIYFSTDTTPAQTESPLAAPPVLLHPSLIRWGRLFRIL